MRRSSKTLRGIWGWFERAGRSGVGETLHAGASSANGQNSHRVNPRDKHPSTVRALARLLQVSPTTVSEALRGVPRVAPETAARVRAAAEQHGYRRNPIAGAVMAEIRRSRGAHYRGTLALIEVAEANRPIGARSFSEKLFQGAAARSAELGFTLDRFTVGEGELKPARLNTVLASRGIGGVLVLPTFMEAHLETIAWDRLAAVYLDRVIRFPPMHSVSTDHHSAIWAALSCVAEKGYRRAGLVLQAQQDQRLQNRWEGAYEAFGHAHRRLELTPILVAPELTEAIFRRWYRAHRPDVVLGHNSVYVDWMRRLRARVPETHGFLALNADMCERPCAAIDQQPTLLGARGAEIVIGQILRGEAGLPENPCNTSVPPRIVPGPTLRG